MEANPRDLMAQAQAGEVRAFIQLIQHFEKRVYHWAFQELPEDTIAQAIVRKVFLHTWRNRPEWPRCGPLEPWRACEVGPLARLVLRPDAATARGRFSSCGRARGAQ